MKNLKTFSVIILSLALVGCGLGNNDQDQVNDSQRKAMKVATGLDINDGVKCVQKTKDENGEAETVMYFYKDNFRYDTKVKSNTPDQQADIEIHSINKDGYTYSWGLNDMMMFGANKKNPAKKTGMKMKMDQDSEMNNDEYSNVNYEELAKNDFQMAGIDCEEWDPDLDIFELPADVEFQDMDAMMNGMMNSMQGGFKSMGEDMNDTCRSMCDMAPASEKEDCLKSCAE